MARASSGPTLSYVEMACANSGGLKAALISSHGSEKATDPLPSRAAKRGGVAAARCSPRRGMSRPHLKVAGSELLAKVPPPRGLRRVGCVIGPGIAEPWRLGESRVCPPGECQSSQRSVAP